MKLFPLLITVQKLCKIWLIAALCSLVSSPAIADSNSEKNEEEFTQALKSKVEELTKKNKELQGKLDALSNPLSIAAVDDWKLVKSLQGAGVFAQDEDRTFLGNLDFSGNDLDSIFNPVGLYGSSVGLDSVWNDVGFFGSTVAIHSARNKLSINPPIIVKNKRIIGHLTVNTLAVSPNPIDPNYLLSLAKRIQGKK